MLWIVEPMTHLSTCPHPPKIRGPWPRRRWIKPPWPLAFLDRPISSTSRERKKREGGRKWDGFGQRQEKITNDLRRRRAVLPVEDMWLAGARPPVLVLAW
jgi:hypothetical protein